MKAKSRVETWRGIVNELGGRCSTRDAAILAHQKRLFPGLMKSAAIKALQADLRRNCSRFDEEGNPAGVVYEIVEDLGDGPMKLFMVVQPELCTLDEAVACLRMRAKGIKATREKYDRFVEWIIGKFGDEGGREAAIVQREFDLG